MLSAFKNFLITLLISALIFGVVGYFATKFLSGVIVGILDGNPPSAPVINAPEDDDDNVEENHDEDLKTPEGESFTFVVVGTDYRPDFYKNYYRTLEDYQKVIDEAKKNAAESDDKKEEKNEKNERVKDSDDTEKDDASNAPAESSNASSKDPVEIPEPDSVLKTDVRIIRATWIAIVRADKENREYAVCYISPETAVTAPCGESDLGEIYGLYGLETLCEYVSGMTGLEVDYRFVLDGVDQLDFVEEFGAASFELKTDLYAGKKFHQSNPPEDDEQSADSDETEGETMQTEPETDENGEVPKKGLVLKVGTHEVGDYTAHIINTFKEQSAEDIEVKSSYILEILKHYIYKCSEKTPEELEKALQQVTVLSYIDNPDGTPSQDYEYDMNDPYATKAPLATDFLYEDVEYIHSMLEAVQYFEYKEFVYPGAYSEDGEKYKPDIKAAFTMFEKYRGKTVSDDTASSDTAN